MIEEEEEKKKTRRLIEVEGKKVSYCLFRNETLVAMDNDKSDNKQGGHKLKEEKKIDHHIPLKSVRVSFNQ